RAAGKPTTSSVDELATMVKEIGRVPAQRNTHFGILKQF
ncbi:MAG: aminofutalosine synthase MqnE, partial [Nitrosopumilus sp.]|nr:aminofutalosine synthase MqnE [Nitrosopumilus sp.]